MTTAYTSLLGLALPVTGELSGTWGDTVNNSITSLLDSAVAGTTTLSTDLDVTLTNIKTGQGRRDGHHHAHTQQHIGFIRIGLDLLKGPGHQGLTNHGGGGQTGQQTIQLRTGVANHLAGFGQQCDFADIGRFAQARQFQQLLTWG